MAEIEKDVVFYDQSDGGVTLSGGEPLMQPEFAEALLKRCQAEGIHTAVDTCGLADPEVLARVSPHVNLFLYDLKIIDDRRHRMLTGGSNQRILANVRDLAARGAHIRIRFPVVAGLNDDRENVEALGELVSSLGLGQVDLLPYHRAGIAKYVRRNAEYRLPDTQPPSEADLARVASRLRRFGLTVRLGG
jgi:pyruvate formate lyase activating enzyme